MASPSNTNDRSAERFADLYRNLPLEGAEGPDDSISNYLNNSKHNIPGDTVTLGQAVDQLSRILASGNQVLIRTIVSNLEAFSQAADQQQRDSARIAKLEEDCGKLKERLESLEEIVKEHKTKNHKRGQVA